MDFLGSLVSLGQSIFQLFGWAVIPGIVLRVILSFMHRGETPTRQKHQKSKKDVVMFLAVMYFG